MKRYLFEYQMGGETFGLVIEASSRHDALARVSAISRSASYRGEVAAVVPAGAGLLAKTWCAIANFFGDRQ